MVTVHPLPINSLSSSVTAITSACPGSAQFDSTCSIAAIESEKMVCPAPRFSHGTENGVMSTVCLYISIYIHMVFVHSLCAFIDIFRKRAYCTMRPRGRILGVCSEGTADECNEHCSCCGVASGGLGIQGLRAWSVVSTSSSHRGQVAPSRTVEWLHIEGERRWWSSLCGEKKKSSLGLC